MCCCGSLISHTGGAQSSAFVIQSHEIINLLGCLSLFCAALLVGVWVEVPPSAQLFHHTCVITLADLPLKVS